MKTFNKTSKWLQRGDTIVEVLVSITILALVLTITFVSTSRSLRQGDSADNRQTATSFAQQQIELIKNIPTASASEYNSLSPTQNFMVCSDGSLKIITTAGSNPCSSPSLGQYSVSDQFDNATGLFTITTTWPGSSTSSGSNDQLTVYYKVPATSAYLPTTCPVGQTGTPPNCTTPPPTCPIGQTGTPPNCVIAPLNPPTVSANSTNWIGASYSQIQLVGTVNPNSATVASTCDFYYSQNDLVNGNGVPNGGATKVPCDQNTSGDTYQPGVVAAAVTATVPVPDGNNYYWHLCASNAAGIACAEGPGYQAPASGGGNPGPWLTSFQWIGNGCGGVSNNCYAWTGTNLANCHINIYGYTGPEPDPNGSLNFTSPPSGGQAPIGDGQPSSADLNCGSNTLSLNQTSGGCGSSCGGGTSGPAWVSFGITYYGNIQRKSTSNGVTRPGWCNDNVHVYLVCFVFVTSGEAAIGGGCTVSWTNPNQQYFVEKQFNGNTADTGFAGTGGVLGWNMNPNSDLTQNPGSGPLTVSCTNLPTKTWVSPGLWDINT